MLNNRRSAKEMCTALAKCKAGNLMPLRQEPLFHGMIHICVLFVQCTVITVIRDKIIIPGKPYVPQVRYKPGL